MKLFFISCMLFTSMLASSYNFTEIRYSDALDSSVELQGEISFEKNSLFIKYHKNNRLILYKDAVLDLKENANTITLSAMESQRVAQYFEIILLLYANDETQMQEVFEVIKKDEETFLKPKNELSRFLEKIILLRVANALKEIKLFMKNRDTITIRIEDEI